MRDAAHPRPVPTIAAQDAGLVPVAKRTRDSRVRLDVFAINLCRNRTRPQQGGLLASLQRKVRVIAGDE